MDPGLVELAVRSAVVLARMKAHQKAQLVHLLSSGLQVSDDKHLKVCVDTSLCTGAWRLHISLPA